MDKAMAYWTEAGVDSVMKPMVGPAIESLDKLIAQGESGQFDFAFVDADKVRINEEGNHMHQSWDFFHLLFQPNYWNYYERILKLLRPGGTIAFDNTLWSGAVIDPNKTDANTMFIKELNKKLAADSERSSTVQLNIGDGYTMCVKK